MLWEFPSPGESNQRASEPQVAVLSRQRPDCVCTWGPVTCRRADGHVQALSLWRPLSMVPPCSPGRTTQVPHSCLDPRSLWPPAALVTSVCPFVGCRMLEEPSLSHTVPRVCSGSVWARRPHKRLAFSLSCKHGGKARARAVLIPTLLRPTIVHCFRGDPPRPGFLRPPRSGPSALASWPEDPAADPALSLEVTLYQAALAVSHGGHRQ